MPTNGAAPVVPVKIEVVQVRLMPVAVSVVPAYLDAYERATKSFSALYRQTGQAAGQINDGYTATPHSLGEVLVKAGEAASQLPQAGRRRSNTGTSLGHAAGPSSPRSSSTDSSV